MRLLAITAALLTLSSPVFANYYTAAQLDADCKTALHDFDDYHKTKHIKKHLQTGNCIGFITGVIEAHNISQEASGNSANSRIIINLERNVFCIPPDTKTEDVVKEVIQDLDQHPEVQKYSAVAVLVDILKKRHPCNQKSNESTSSSATDTNDNPEPNSIGANYHERASR